MISFQDALKLVLNTKLQLGTEKAPLLQAQCRVLAENCISDINMPPFNKSAMDGFAIRESDIKNTLTIIETVAAGQTPTKRVEAGQATKIMTGAPVPEGADFVIQVELSEIVDAQTVRFTGRTKNNIIPFAEDVKENDLVLNKGVLIDARHMAVLASVGCVNPLVYKQPKVGILSTGNEIVEPEYKPKASQIRNSNGNQLVAQVMQCNALPLYFGIVKDTYEETFNAIKTGLETCDVLLISGGVSMGDFDFVPKVLSDLGVTILFDSVAVQPGKPTTFGLKDDKIIFGLPGNPVSSFVQFEILVKPLLYKLMGSIAPNKTIKLPLGKPFARKKAERLEFLPITISDEGKVYRTVYHGSAHIFALPNAHGLAQINEGIKELNEGDLVDVRLF
jgi:molybdopterin molybdotransferase